LLFRQIELNWINAPLEDQNDYLALYLDVSDPEMNNQLPVSVHKIAGNLHGKITTDHYLPLVDFYNSTTFKYERQTPFALHTNHRQLHNGGNNEIENHLHEDLPHSTNVYPMRAHPRHGREDQEQRWSSRSMGTNVYGLSNKEPQWEKSKLNWINLEEACLGYCVAYHSGKRMLAKNCLKISPTWMQDSFQAIGSRSLPELMLPGTHNSGTYPRQLDESVLQMISKYQMNQDENIFNQLVFGIRYLDLRVGYSKVKQRAERLWIYHDIFRTEVSADEVFEQVRKFLDLTTHEIVIMDFHRFTVGFQNENSQTLRERHAKLIELLFKHLGPYVVPSYLGQHAPLQEYISMNKRLLVGYAGRSQLIGSQSADQHHSIFGQYQQASTTSPNQQTGAPNLDRTLASKRNPQDTIRDMDSAKQDQEDRLRGNNDESDTQDNQNDRRMGTRIYNKLKSLRLINHSFSKRSTVLSREGNESKNSSAPQVKRDAAQRQERNGKLTLTPIARLGAQSMQDDLAAQLARVALFFPSVRHLWPNRDTLDGLSQYMNETTCRKYFGELRSMMVELTPTVFGAISDKYDGNRQLANLVNRPVTDWIRDRWLHCINVVASDFFLGNDLIRLAIYANKRRFLNRDHSGEGNSAYSKGPMCPKLIKIEHLIDKPRIPIQFAYQIHPKVLHRPEESATVPLMSAGSVYKQEDIIAHYLPNGDRIMLRPLGSSVYSNTYGSSSSGQTNSGQAQSRERRDSFVENVSDGFADLYSSFKRLFNL